MKPVSVASGWIRPGRFVTVQPVAVKRVVPAFVVLLLTVGSAGPAAAATGALAEGRPWHYWISVAFIAAAGFVLLVALPVGYYLRVWRLRHRGR